MKKIIAILLLPIVLIGCSAIDYSELTSPVSPSDTQIERIIALGLSHSDSLKEANKLQDSDLVAIVIKELENRKMKADDALLEAGIVADYAEKVKISDDNSNFTGLEITETKTIGLLVRSDLQVYFLKSFKDQDNGIIKHKLHTDITYFANKKRGYSSASFCDVWRGCSNDDTQLDIILVSSGGSNCTTSGCDYNEIMELNLSDVFLRENMENNLTISFNSKKESNKITLPSEYIKGYLNVAN